MNDANGAKSSAPTAEPVSSSHETSPHPAGWLVPAITAVGIVYGDIGTSPLYALKVALADTGHAIPLRQEVFGIVSLIFWALLIVVTLKYVIVVMRADNEGEGGILALLSLATTRKALERRAFPVVVILGVIGAAFIYGDGVITPAISVLSAMEGLKVFAPGLESWIVPMTLGILIGLFSIQSRGTGKIGRLFGPIMITWFVSIGVLGLLEVLRAPAILGALNPLHGITFLMRERSSALMVIGAVFLAVTGAEALYADMGHVGATPLRRAWFALVLPGLMLSYLGQGALVLAKPETAANPFFMLAPDWLGVPLVILATMASIIASQAVISGVFSLTNQAIQMRLLPRMPIRATSGEYRGQIYLGTVNWAQMVGCILVVLIFRTSDDLAGAYGIAVSGTMLVTSFLLFEVIRQRWRWPLAAAILLVGAFASIDLVFFTANVTKFLDGGWFPLLLGAGLAYLMLTWRSGTLEVQKRLEEMSVPFDDFLKSLDEQLVTRIPGCAVVLTRAADYASPVLVQQVRHSRVLHEHVILLTIQPIGRPIVPPRERLQIIELGHGFHRVIAKLGFMQRPDLQNYVKGCVRLGLECAKEEIHYMVAYEHVTRRPRKPHFPVFLWHPFSLMSKTGTRLTDFLQVPEKNVFEVGIKVQI